MTLGQVALPIRDPSRAVAFYRDVLGFRLLFETSTISFFDCGGIRLMLGPPEADYKPSGATLYFRVADIERTAEVLKAHGVTFVRDAHLVARMQNHELWMAFFDDLDGNPLALMCEKALRRDDHAT